MKRFKTALCCLVLWVSLPTIIYARVSLVQITGASMDTAIKHIKIVNYPPLWLYKYASIRALAEQSVPDNKFDLKFNLSKSTELTLMLLGKNIYIYVSPGDNITFVISRVNNKPNVVFTGKNAAQYNYVARSDEYVLSKLNLGFEPRYSKQKGIDSYQHVIEEWYKYRSFFFENYIKENNVSAAFIDYYRDEIKYEYIQLIYTPLYNHSVQKADLPNGYLVKSNEFLTNVKSVSHISRNILLALTFKYIYGYSDNIWDSFDNIYQSINSEFNGITHTYLLTNLIGIYTKNQLPNYHVSLINAIKKAHSSITDTLCLNYINECKLDYLLLNQPFSQDVLNNSCFKELNSNKLFSLKQLLEIYKDQPLYIDFWASWCAACRDNIANSTDAKRYLTDKKIAYIYISIDKDADIQKWKDAAIQDGTTQNQYLLINAIKSPLAVFLKLKSIPRYLIMNDEHQLKNYDAPRPTTYLLSDLKISLSTALNKAVKFI